MRSNAAVRLRQPAPARVYFPRAEHEHIDTGNVPRDRDYSRQLEACDHDFSWTVSEQGEYTRVCVACGEEWPTTCASRDGCDNPVEGNEAFCAFHDEQIGKSWSVITDNPHGFLPKATDKRGRTHLDGFGRDGSAKWQLTRRDREHEARVYEAFQEIQRQRKATRALARVERRKRLRSGSRWGAVLETALRTGSATVALKRREDANLLRCTLQQSYDTCRTKWTVKTAQRSGRWYAEVRNVGEWTYD